MNYNIDEEDEQLNEEDKEINPMVSIAFLNGTINSGLGIMPMGIPPALIPNIDEDEEKLGQ